MNSFFSLAVATCFSWSVASLGDLAITNAPIETPAKQSGTVAAPTIQIAFAEALGCNISNTSDPHCAAVKIMLPRKRQVMLFLEIFYLEEQCRCINQQTQTLVAIRQIAQTRRLRMEEIEVSARLAALEDDLVEIQSQLQAARIRFANLSCLPSPQFPMPNSLAAPCIECSPEQLVRYRCFVPRKHCPGVISIPCRDFTISTYADFKNYEVRASQLLANGIANADAALTLAMAGIASGIGTHQISDAVRLTELDGAMSLHEIGLRCKRDRAAIELELFVGKCISNCTSTQTSVK